MSASTTKRCARCEQDLPRTDFTTDPRMRSGLKSYCRTCCKEDARKRRAANPERARELQRVAARRRYTTEWRREQALRHLYGLTLEQYESMLEAQSHRCAICRTDTPGGRGTWHVDHCHKTGAVRGLLCTGCNVGIGHLSHDPARLRAAAIYIEEHSS